MYGSQYTCYIVLKGKENNETHFLHSVYLCAKHLK